MKVSIQDALLKQYKDKEIVSYVATNLKRIVAIQGQENPEWQLANYGAVMTDIQHLSEILSAVDKRMNGSENVNVVL